MLETVTIVLVTSVISSLVTYFITSVSYTNYMKDTFMGYVKIHEKIFHQKEVDSYVEKKIKEHTETCPYGGTQLKVVNLLEYLVRKTGTNPEAV
jgi:hypothetical protein